MIPVSSIPEGFILSEESKTNRTYQLFPNKIQGFVEEADALKQAIYKMLFTEKYQYPIYSFDYGIAFDDLIGKDPVYVTIELKRRISECLLEDERIKSVENFRYDLNGDEVLCTFKVKSIYGDFTMTKEVSN